MVSLILTIVVLGTFALAMIATRQIVHNVEDRRREARERRDDQQRYRAEVVANLHTMSHDEMTQAVMRGDISTHDFVDLLVRRRYRP